MPCGEAASDPLTSAMLALSIGAPTTKRKAGADGSNASRRSSSHYGLSADSSESVRLVAMSRLLATRDASILEASARTTAGAAMDAALRALVRRVAVSTGGALTGLGYSWRGVRSVLLLRELDSTPWCVWNPQSL